jgi:hypothetical protein
MSLEGLWQDSQMNHSITCWMCYIQLQMNFALAILVHANGISERTLQDSFTPHRSLKYDELLNRQQWWEKPIVIRGRSETEYWVRHIFLWQLVIPCHAWSMRTVPKVGKSDVFQAIWYDYPQWPSQWGVSVTSALGDVEGNHPIASCKNECFWRNYVLNFWSILATERLATCILQMSDPWTDVTACGIRPLNPPYA